jgi:hypothetical protein
MGQKMRKVMEISHAEGIGKWWGEAVASRWHVLSGRLPRQWRKSGEEGGSLGRWSLLQVEEREGMEAGPHIGDRKPVAAGPAGMRRVPGHSTSISISCGTWVGLN